MHVQDEDILATIPPGAEYQVRVLCKTAVPGDFSGEGAIYIGGKYLYTVELKIGGKVIGGPAPKQPAP